MQAFLQLGLGFASGEREERGEREDTGHDTDDRRIAGLGPAEEDECERDNPEQAIQNHIDEEILAFHMQDPGKQEKTEHGDDAEPGDGIGDRPAAPTGEEIPEQGDHREPEHLPQDIFGQIMAAANRA